MIERNTIPLKVGDVVEIMDMRLIDPDGAPGLGYGANMTERIGQRHVVGDVRVAHQARYGPRIRLKGVDWTWASTWLRPVNQGLKGLVARYQKEVYDQPKQNAA